ncbi:MAG: HDOD domain-containing protein [Betaproteobacteria bacterium]
MTRLQRENIVVRLQHLASLPDIVMELLSSFASEDFEVNDIARKISYDQALSARVLRVANSSFFGLPGKISTIQEAIVLLGFRAVRSMVLAVSMSNAFKTDHCRGFNAHDHQRHCLGASIVAWNLADMVGCSRDLAFTAGLLHDVGQLALASNFPQEYGNALAYQRQHDCFITTAEREILGMDHAEVGGVLAEIWHFPKPLRLAVAGHHLPTTDSQDPLAGLMHLADVTAHALGMAQSPDEQVMPLDPEVWRRLGGDWATFRKQLPTIERNFTETCRLFLA